MELVTGQAETASGNIDAFIYSTGGGMVDIGSLGAFWVLDKESMMPVKLPAIHI
jgi:probable HAF family extracellular repeat protein